MYKGTDALVKVKEKYFPNPVVVVADVILKVLVGKTAV